MPWCFPFLLLSSIPWNNFIYNLRIINLQNFSINQSYNLLTCSVANYVIRFSNFSFHFCESNLLSLQSVTHSFRVVLSRSYARYVSQFSDHRPYLHQKCSVIIPVGFFFKHLSNWTKAFRVFSFNNFHTNLLISWKISRNVHNFVSKDFRLWVIYVKDIQ